MFLSLIWLFETILTRLRRLGVLICQFLPSFEKDEKSWADTRNPKNSDFVMVITRLAFNQFSIG